MAEHSRAKSNYRSQFNPFPLPPCPYMSGCNWGDQDRHTQKYSHPCPCGKKANCSLAGDHRHNKQFYHVEMLEQALSTPTKR